MTASPLLSIDSVTKKFGGLVAVNDMTFDVHAGETLGIIGPNGSGKTTLLNLVSGALKLSSGSITFLGHSTGGLSEHKISRLGIGRTFQLVRVLPSLSVSENCMAGMVFGHRRLWGHSADSEVDAILDRVGLLDKRSSSVSGLTYIDQKKLELARALGGSPSLLFLDEWLAGLNPTELREGIDLIARLNSDGITIVLVEHVMDAIRSLCGRCVVMASGSKIAQGAPGDVLSDSRVIEVYLGSDDGGTTSNA